MAYNNLLMQLQETVYYLQKRAEKIDSDYFTRFDHFIKLCEILSGNENHVYTSSLDHINEGLKLTDVTSWLGGLVWNPFRSRQYAKHLEQIKDYASSYYTRNCARDINDNRYKDLKQFLQNYLAVYPNKTIFGLGQAAQQQSQYQLPAQSNYQPGLDAAATYPAGSPHVQNSVTPGQPQQRGNPQQTVLPAQLTVQHNPLLNMLISIAEYLESRKQVTDAIYDTTQTTNYQKRRGHFIELLQALNTQPLNILNIQRKIADADTQFAYWKIPYFGWKWNPVGSERYAELVRQLNADNLTTTNINNLQLIHHFGYNNALTRLITQCQQSGELNAAAVFGFPNPRQQQAPQPSQGRNYTGLAQQMGGQGTPVPAPAPQAPATLTQAQLRQMYQLAQQAEGETVFANAISLGDNGTVAYSPAIPAPGSGNNG